MAVALRVLFLEEKMIIIMGDPKIHEGIVKLFKDMGPAIQYCSTLMDLKPFEGHTTLILLDTSGKPTVLSVGADRFTRNLIEHGLPKSVTKILLVMSCNPEYYSWGSDSKLYESADIMAKQLANGFYHTQVHCLNNSDNGPRFLVPPDDQNKEWQIYQIHDSSETHYTDLASLKEEPNKERIDTTPDILAYLNDPKKAYITKVPKNPAIELIETMERRARLKQLRLATTTPTPQLLAEIEKEEPKPGVDASGATIPSSIPSPKS